MSNRLVAAILFSLMAFFLWLSAVQAAHDHPWQIPAQSRQERAASSFAGVLTWHNDNMRTGQNLQETILTPGNVNAASFGKLFSFAVDGQVYAQPLYVPNVNTVKNGLRNVVYVTTENDSVYAFDADGIIKGSLWHTSFINSEEGITTIPSSQLGCKDLQPRIGITGTPAIAGATGTLYVVSATQEDGDDILKLHALDITSGSEKLGGPVNISANIAGVSFDPVHQLQRPALLLANNTIYIGFGSHCDHPGYHGWLMAYNATSLKQTDVFLVTPDGNEGSFWMGGAGPASDANGAIYAISANGTFDGSSGGSDYSQSFLKFNSALARLDYFTPFNEAFLSQNDLDIGSSGPLLLPDQSGAHPHVMVGAGKEGRLCVVDRDNLGKFHAGSDSQIVQSIVHAFPAGLYTSPAYWNGHVYFAGNQDVLKNYTVVQSKLSLAASGEITNPFPGAVPSVSANGTSNAIVWTIENRISGATLRAYNAAAINEDLYNSGGAVTEAGVKFAAPTIANGKVYVGTSGHLIAFGLR